jgi:DNA-directed RNA polymerase subunit K/omega
MNAELLKKASEKVGNPAFLVNLISRRVRQLNRHDVPSHHSLVNDAGNLSAGDIALREIIEEKIGWDTPEPVILAFPTPKKTKKR